MLVRDAMTKDPLVISADTSVRAVIDTLMSVDVRHLPVVDGGELLGIVTERDLRAYMMPAVDHTHPEHRTPVLEQPVRKVVTIAPVHVTPDASLGAVAAMMAQTRMEAVAVVAPGTKHLVGFLSYVDVLRAAKDLL